MRRTLYTLLIMLVLALLPAQAKDVVPYPCDNLIEKGDYTLAWEKLKKLEQKSPFDYTIEFAYYRIFSAPDYEDRDLKKAYAHLCHSQDYLKDCLPKDIEKAVSSGYSAAFYSTEFANLGLTAFRETAKRNSVSAWNDWLSCYKRVPQQQIAQATSVRDAMAFKKARATNTLHAYEAFVHDYPNAKEASSAWEIVYEMAYKQIEQSGSEDDYRQYCKKYPNSPYTRMVDDRAHSMEVSRVVRRDDWRTQRQYLLTSGDTTRWRDTVSCYFIQTVRHMLSLEGAKWGVRNMPQPYRDSCWMILRDISLEEKDLQALVRFHTKYVNYAIKSVQKSDMRLIAANEKYKLGELTTDQLIDIVAPYYPAYNKLQEQIADDVKAMNWSAALAKVKAHQKAFGSDYRYNNLLRALEDNDDTKVISTSLGPGVNTSDGNEFSPVVSADGELLFFCGSKRADNVGKEDIFLSKRKIGSWDKAVPMNDINTADRNEAPLSLSTNGTTMLVFLSGKIAITRKTANGWTPIEQMRGKINTCDWQADAMITSDGKALLFAAMNKGGNENDMSINIFVSLLQSNGSWGTPIDLGPQINTPLVDRSPFLHPDMHTLYFCSEGHGSLGGMDVFVSKRLREDSWTEWSTPVNMGKVVNTVGNECWYKISTDGQLAYFSKRINKQNDIYQLHIPKHLRPQPVATVSGKITNRQGKPVVTTIRWEDLEARELVGLSNTDPTDGSFFIVLPEGRNYGYYVFDEDLFPISRNIDLRESHEQIRVVNDIEAVSIKEMIEEEIPVTINNLFFNTGEWELLPASINELARVANIIRRQQLLVEISGHTDDVGDDESNLILSRNRARAVKEYLIRLGVESRLLMTEGYGESRPVATNKTPEGRQKNRRVELKFVK